MVVRGVLRDKVLLGATDALDRIADPEGEGTRVFRDVFADTAMAEPWRRQGGGISEGAAQAAGDAWRLGAQRRRAAAREAGERFPFAGVLAARPTA